MKTTARVKLNDVARKVGVHPSTASRVLNPKTRGMVSPSLVSRVLQAADELGYRPNPFALGLRTQRSHAIGVMIPDLSNPVFPPIILGIERVLEAAGYTAILANSHIRGDHDREILERLKSRQVDGLILATAHRQDALIAECMEEQIPMVLVNRTVDDDQTISVVADDAWGMALAVDHMVDQGHAHIAYLAGPQSMSTGQGRYLGFIEAMKARGLKPEPGLIEFCDTFSIAAGRDGLERLLEGGREFTAVITANDLLALGCYETLEARRLRCPDDLSVTGVNDMPFSDKFCPPLTTVRIPLDDMGTEAARLLLELIEQPDAKLKSVKLKPRLIVRGSTVAAAGVVTQG